MAPLFPNASLAIAGNDRNGIRIRAEIEDPGTKGLLKGCIIVIYF